MGKLFSASEINKFCYCPAQWYYEREYGAKQLNEWRRERNAEMGWDAPEGETPFERGRKFHEGYTRRYAARLVLRRVILAAALVAFLVLVFIWFGDWL